MEAARKSHDRTQYQGRRLFYLLSALLAPAGLLYLRIVLGLAATDSRVGPVASRALAAGSSAFLLLFFAAQAFCAFYLRRLLPSARSVAGQVTQYAGLFAFGLLFSLAAAISLEAFGLAVFLRAAGR